MTRFPSLELFSSEVMLRQMRIIHNKNVEKIKAWNDGLKEIETLSEEANSLSQEASQNATEAKDQSDTTQQQLDNIILENGNSDAEVVQARGEYELLYERLDAGETQTQDINTELTDARAEYNALANRLSSIDEGISWSRNDLLSREINVLYPPEGLSPVVGDGVADDTAAFEAIRDYARTNGGIFYVPASARVNLPNGSDLFGIRDVKIDGRITGELGGVLIAGIRSGIAVPFKGYFNRIEGLTLRIQGVKNGNITINSAPHLLLWADDTETDIDSVAYSTFYLGEVKEVVLDSSGSGSWINENRFIGGRVSKLTIKGEYTHNHNIFYNPTLERSNISILRGSSNKIIGARFEFDNEVVFGEQAWDNEIIRSWHTFSGGYLTGRNRTSFTDNGRNNLVHDFSDAYFNISDVFYCTGDTNNFNVEDVVKNSNGTANITSAGRYKNIIETDIFEVESDFGVEVASDTALWRGFVEIYDANKEKIKGDVGNFLVSTDFIWSTSSHRYYMSVNKSNFSFACFKNTTVAYVKFYVIPNTSGIFNHLRVTLTAPKNKPIRPVKIKGNKGLSASTSPIDGYFREGEIVYNSSPELGDPVGWVCLSGGEFSGNSNPTFGTFGTIE